MLFLFAIAWTFFSPRSLLYLTAKVALLCCIRLLQQSIIACYQSEVFQPPPKEQNYRFTSNEIIFNKRFEAFSVLPQPPRLTYNDFLQGSDYSNVDLEDLIHSATESFKHGRSMLDRILSILASKEPNDYSTALYSPIQKTEALSLVKVCIGNNLFLHQLFLSQKGDAGSRGSRTKTAVEFDFTVHKQFCVLKLNPLKVRK